jgi:hypothetical protein
VPTTPIEIRALPMLLKIEIPVVGKVPRHASTREPLAVVGLDGELSLLPVAQVINVTAYGLEILTTAAQHFDHHLGRTPDGQGDLLDFPH